jgi:hypothetical protein
MLECLLKQMLAYSFNHSTLYTFPNGATRAMWAELETDYHIYTGYAELDAVVL